MANCTFISPRTLKRQPQPLGVVADEVQVVGADLVGRQHAGRVARMHAGLLDVLHDRADHHPLPVAQRVHVDLVGVLHELVDQQRLAGRGLEGLLDEAGQLAFVADDRHGPAAQHEGGPHQHRVADLRRGRACASSSVRAMAFSGWGMSSSASRAAKRSRSSASQIDCGEVPRIGTPAASSPAARLSGVCPPNCTITPSGRSRSDHVQHVLQRQRLEVEPVGRVVVGADRLRVAVEHDRLEAQVAQRKGRLAAAVVELHALADAVRPAAQDQDLAPVGWAVPRPQLS